MKPLAIVVLISGNGSNLQAIIDAVAQKKIPVVIRAVISNREDAYGLQRAAAAGITTHVVAHQDFASREAFDAALQVLIDNYAPDIICLAGFMRYLGAAFVDHYPNRIINIHPSLLPKYPGLHTHARVIAAKEAFHGATIHIVTRELDAGPVLIQAKTAVLPDDTVQTLRDRVQQLEHRLYPEALRQLAQAPRTV